MIGKWAGVSKRKADEIIRDSVTEQQEAAVQSLLDTRKQPWVSGVRKSPHSLSSSHVASASGGAHLPLLCRVSGNCHQCSWTFGGATMPWWKWQSRTSFIVRISRMQWWNHLDSSD